MTRNVLNLVSALLILGGFILIVLGLGSAALLWQLGLGLVGVAMILAFLTRWAKERNARGETGA